MAKGKKKDEGIEILEDPNAIVEKANEFLENKRNRALVLTIGGVLAAIVVGIAGYNYYISDMNKTAQEELFQAQYYFEADSLGLALNGDGNSYGFLEIIEEFPGTKVANLSNFYAGASYLRLGDFDGAIRYLKDFSSSDYLVQARAYSLMGDAYMEEEDFDNAADYYQQAADYRSNEYFSPIYLKKLAVANESAGDLSAAVAAYQVIIDEYPTSEIIHDAKKHKARLEALVAEL
jgi:tetratricopeptide (TPR) repeat protein